MTTITMTFQIIHDGEHKYIENAIELEIEKICKKYDVSLVTKSQLHIGINL